MPDSSRKLFCLFAAAALAGGVPFVVTTAGAQAPPIQSNLILNGDFEALTDWTLVDIPAWGNASIDLNCHNPNPTGCLKTRVSPTASGGTGRISNAWQCIDVEPNRAYGMAMGVWGHPNNAGVNNSARLMLVDATGETCPSADSPPKIEDALAALFLFDPPHGWVDLSAVRIVPPGVTRVAAALHTCCAFSNQTGNFDKVYFFDDVVLGEHLPNVDMQMAISDSQLVPLQEFTIDVTYGSQYNGMQPDLRIFHDNRISLVDYDCEVGDVIDASQGNDHFFRWFNIPGDPEPYDHSCTITARAGAGFAGTFDLHAVADCEGCDLDINPANNEQAIEVEILARPDVTATLELPEFPEASDSFQIQLVVENQGTGGAIVDTAVTTSMPLSLVSSSGTGFCTHFDTIDDQTFERSVWLDAGQSSICDLGFQAPPDQEQAALTVQVFNVVSGDYDPGNNSDSASTRLVRLLVNRNIDGVDFALGDGICEGTAGVGNCSLRTAVMEANALAAATGRTFTVELPYSQFAYQLTFTTGEAQQRGSLDIFRNMNLIGVPDDGGALPMVITVFPSGDADRLIQIGNPAGFVRIENMHLRGQNLVPTDTDGLGTEGGLILHRSGGLVLRNVTLAKGATDGRGGAIYSTSDDANGHLTLERVEMFDNEANQGGAVAFVPESFATLTLEESEIHGNDAGNVGGGIYAARIEPGALPFVAINRSTLHDNTAGGGGGAHFNDVPLAALNNSTVSGNVGQVLGGGVGAVQDTALAVNNSTIAFNQARPGDDDDGLGGGIFLHSNATATLYNSIVSGNTAQLECSQPNPPLPPICVPRAADCYGTLDSAGYNAMNSALDTECHLNDTTGDYNGGVSLAPLADNGGPTPTHAPDSIAQIVDAGDPECKTSPGGDPLTVDQRGALRPADGDDDGDAICDRGAHELSESARIAVVVDDDSLGRVNSSPGGIACGASTSNQCSALFSFEAEVTLTATVASGSGGEFVGWEGACAGQGNPCTLMAAGDQETTALFAPVSATRTLTVELLGETAGGAVTSNPAGINCPDGQCEGDFDTGETVQLSAAANPGFEFVGFVGEGCAGTGPCTVTMDFNRQVWAEFARATGHVDVTLAGTGSGHVSSDPIGISCPNDCDHDWPANETVTLTPQPASGSYFAGWSGACSGTGDCVLDISQAPHDVTAVFDEGDPSPGGDTIFSDRFEQ